MCIELSLGIIAASREQFAFIGNGGPSSALGRKSTVNARPRARGSRVYGGSMVRTCIVTLLLIRIRSS